MHRTGTHLPGGLIRKGGGEQRQSAAARSEVWQRSKVWQEQIQDPVTGVSSVAGSVFC